MQITHVGDGMQVGEDGQSAATAEARAAQENLGGSTRGHVQILGVGITDLNR